jgi:hypothetical protein
MKWRAGLLLLSVPLLVVAMVIPALAATSADFTYTGTWADGANDEKATEQQGATATLAFNVTGSDGRVGISGLKTPWSGKASVKIDSGAAVTKDLYLASGPSTAEWYLSPLLPAGPHTVTVTVLHTKQAAATGFWVSIQSARLVRAELGGGTPPPPPPPPPASNLPYGPGSFFQSRVDGVGVPVDAVRTDQFHQFMATNVDQASVNFPKVNMNEGWSGHNWISQPGDPVWKLSGTVGNDDARLDVLRTTGFHVKDSVLSTIPTGTQDRLLVVRDPINGYTAQFADVVPNFTTHTLTASSAGVMWHSSNGLDARNPHADDQRNWVSRGRIPDAMQVPRSELDAAVAAGTGVGHVMHIFFVETNGSATPCFFTPMVGCEGKQAGWGEEGLRLRIKPGVDLAARGLTGAALAIARTLQQNGGYLGDNSGSTTQLKIGHPSDYADTNLTTNVFQGKITWDDFEVVQPGFGG